jgi:hypothetical protein
MEACDSVKKAAVPGEKGGRSELGVVGGTTTTAATYVAPSKSALPLLPGTDENCPSLEATISPLMRGHTHLRF